MSRRVSRKALGGAGLIAAGIALLAALALAWMLNGPGPAAREGETTLVVLESGKGVGRIAEVLEESGVVGSATAFALAARLSGAGSDLKAGEYEFASRASLASVLGQVRDGRVVRRSVTIPEGWTSAMAVDALNALSALEGAVAEPPEGSLLPDTYAYRRGETRQAVIERMQAAHDKLLADLWAERQPGLPLATPEEAVVLASIVEKETGVASERPRVAAVFTNRLRAGMPLQSDPTVIYGVSKGRPLGRGILASELARETPWNTYRRMGLPPTPIANPGREALAAVLNPPSSDELFFVADGTGGHAFAVTYEQHNRNVQRWRAIERQKAAEASR